MCLICKKEKILLSMLVISLLTACGNKLETHDKDEFNIEEKDYTLEYEEVFENFEILEEVDTSLQQGQQKLLVKVLKVK